MSPNGAAIDAVITLLVWDAHEATSRLLASLDRGVADTSKWQLYILDQGSSAETAAMLRAFARRDADRVKLLRLEENIGYGPGHNRLFHESEHMRADYLVTLNSDVVFHDPCWLDRLTGFMARNPDVGIAGPAGVVYHREPVNRLGWCRGATADELSTGRYDSISGSVCILREAMIREIGLFDESFAPAYYEDTDLCFRAKAAGWRMGVCPLQYGHRDLGDDKSTASIKHAFLTEKYGNFQKKNRNLFVERWLESPPGPLDGTAARRLFPNVYFPSRAGELSSLAV